LIQLNYYDRTKAIPIPPKIPVSVDKNRQKKTQRDRCSPPMNIATVDK